MSWSGPESGRVAPAWIASAALTVLSAGALAALTLVSAPAPQPAAEPPARVMAAYQAAPVPVHVVIPAPPAPPAAAPAPVAAPSPARTTARTPAPARTRASAPARVVAAVRRSNPLCEGEGWQVRRGQATMAKLRRPSDARAIPVVFRPGRPDILGLADLHARRVDVFVRSCAKQSDALLLHVLAHELGHVVDAARLDNGLREQWKAARGIPAGTPWFGCAGCNDFATPAGDFAETYAQWQRGATTNRSKLAPAPSRAQLADLAARFFRPL